MDKLILADIQALAASVDYGGQGLITSASTVLGLSAALFLSNLDLWQGVGYSLTDGEIDDIQAMIAQLEADLIQAGDMYPQYRVKATRTDPFVLPSDSSQAIIWQSEIYDPEDMLTLPGLPTRFYVQEAGMYHLQIVINWPISTIGSRQILVLKTLWAGGTEWVGRAIVNNIPLSAPQYQHLDILDIAAQFDYYQVFWYHTAGVPLTMLNNYIGPLATIVKW